MISRRLKKVVLPIVLASSLVALAFVFCMDGLSNQFREKSNLAQAALIGLIAEKNPELDPTEIIRLLRQSGGQNESFSQKVQIGQKILTKYGYFDQDFANESAEDFENKAVFMSVGALFALSLLLAGYFCFKDWYNAKQIKRLTTYLQELSLRTYDLRLEYNSESELSFLSNELYKITVLLKEAAKTNQQERQNLETALADISHQLRTPLTSLQITLDNLYDDPEMPTELRQDFLRSAGRQVEAMSHLVTTLLNLAKLDNKTIQMKNRSLKTKDFLEQVIEKVAVLADIAEVELITSGDLEGKIELDNKWQTEALANIIKNCIEHSPAGEKIEIKVENSPLLLRFIITDHGEGIPSGELKHIFERFYRTSAATEDSVGIGLSFAKAVVEANNGQISVKSREGQGTEFKITYFKN